MTGTPKKYKAHQENLDGIATLTYDPLTKYNIRGANDNRANKSF